MKNKNYLGMLITLCGGICWGISGCFGQYLFQEKDITAAWLVAVRLVLAGVVLVLLGLIQQKSKLFDIFKNKADCKHLLIFSMIGMLSCQYTYFAAIQYANAGTATVLQSTSCILILIVLCLKEKRLPKRFETAAIICAFFGTVILSTHGNFSSMAINSKALFFGLTSAVAVMGYNFLAGDLVVRYGTYAVVGFAMLISGIVMTPFVRPWEAQVSWDFQSVLAVLGVVVIGTAVAFSLYLKGVSMVGPLTASLLATIEPVTAIVISFLFLGSSFQAMDFIGFAMIIGTVIALSLKQRGRGVEVDAESTSV